MICRYLTVTSMQEAQPLLDGLTARHNPVDGSAKDTEATVKDILEAVRKNGLDAVVDYTRRFDCKSFAPDMFRIDPAEAARAAASIPGEDAKVISEAAAHIREFHQEQKQRSWFVTRPDGSILGQKVSPVDRAGLYVPGGKGGTTPLISSLLMNAIPAQVAGVPEICVISPPREDGTVSPYILAAAHILGINEIYAAGSAWAIAALAHGAGSLKPVDVIAGPGNIFVTTAKRLLLGTVGIDMLAGPSEILILADETANPAWAAADMLGQAEHDCQASALCVTTSKPFAESVLTELEKQCRDLPRAEIAEKSLRDYGAVVVVPCMDLGVDLSNKVAPEHLELLVKEPWGLLSSIRHAGAIFMGSWSPEAVGDYYAGPNHVLPTMGTARFSSALSVETFCKKSSIISASSEFTRKGAEAVARLARLEGLEAHARSALCRAPGKE